MLRNPAEKYRPFPAVRLTGRKWPSRTIHQAPVWMSTDLRDGNQALIEPMNAAQKLEFFDMLVAIGFKEIEVGFPSASQTDFDFVRKLIEEKRIPDDVTIEVFVPSRAELIARTFEALDGAPRAIVHLYNAICPSFRRIVFNQSKAEIKALAVDGTRIIKENTQARPGTHWTFQYSPETFNTTELPFAREVCDAVAQTWRPTRDHKMIVNLPASVEAATPNVFADQIEWMDRNLGYRDSIVLSVHPHNDRGTAVAAAELALLAGADRVEGCLFGNGERTGNVDLVALAMNLDAQGVDTGLDFSDIAAVRRVVERCNRIPVHPRHPYAGDAVMRAAGAAHRQSIAADQHARWPQSTRRIVPSPAKRSSSTSLREIPARARTPRSHAAGALTTRNRPDRASSKGSLDRATCRLPRNQAPLPVFLRMNRRVGNRKQQRAVIRFHLDQRSTGDDARLPSNRQHILRLHLDLPIAAAPSGNPVDELPLRFALAIRVDIAHVLREQHVERLPVAVDHRTKAFSLEPANRFDYLCRHCSAPRTGEPNAASVVRSYIANIAG
jgi:2-isopropylmalate synthase